MQFKDFIINEKFASYGFENYYDRHGDFKKTSPNLPREDGYNDHPMPRFNLEYATNILSRHAIGLRYPKVLFVQNIQWGEDVGALRVRFGTRYQVIIEQLSSDLQGNDVWVAKRLFYLNNDYFANKEEVVADEILKELNFVNENPPESPNGEFDQMDKLMDAIANRTSKVVNDPLFFEANYKINDTEFIVVFLVKGHGVQAPDQRRVERVELHVKYYPEHGIIKSIQTNIESSLKQREWQIMPTDFEFKFMPSQSRSEIVNILSTSMKYY